MALCSPVMCRETQRKHVFLQPQCSYTILCALQMKMLSFCAIALTWMWRSAWIKDSTRHTLSSVVDVLGCPGLCLSHTSVLPLWNSEHQNHTYFCDIMLTSYTSTSCRWISTWDVFFRHKNLIPTSYLNGRTRFRQRFHLLTETSTHYCTTSSIYWHFFNAVIVSAV